VSAIKPPGAPGSVQGPTEPEGSSGAKQPAGTSFHERVEQTQGARAGGGALTGTDSAKSVIAELRAGQITPDVALQRLTDLAVRRSGAPPAMRATIESQLRGLMSNDPLVQDLIRQMGASTPTSGDGE
jgi:hypothetical protein